MRIQALGFIGLEARATTTRRARCSPRRGSTGTAIDGAGSCLLLALFELCRRDTLVYGSRLPLYQMRCPIAGSTADGGTKYERPPRRKRTPVLGWVLPVLSVSDVQLLKFVG